MATIQEPVVRQVVTPITTFPPEVVTVISENLHKEDLKTVRFLCHYFEEVAIPLLYDKVIISDQEPNFAPFDCIIGNPRLSKHVKILVYDIQLFKHHRLENYLVHLFRQLNADLMSRLAGFDKSTLPQPLRKELERVRYFQDTMTTRGRLLILLPWKIDVERGHRTNRSHNTRINYAQSSISIRHRMTAAFNNCSGLQRVEIGASWTHYSQPIGDDINSLLPKYYSSGLLARSWHPFWLRPKNPSQECRERSPLVEDVFDIIRDSGKQMTHLSIGKGCNIGPELHVVPTSMFIDMPLVFKGLTSLSLEVSKRDLPRSHNYTIQCLRPALRTARGLKHLTFKASNYSLLGHVDTMRYPLYPLFQDLIFPALVSVHLSGVTGTVNRYLEFLRSQPLLQSLHLDSIDLLQHREQGNAGSCVVQPTYESCFYFIEGLRQIQALNYFSIVWPLRLYNNAVGVGAEYYVPDKRDWPTIKALLERYVLHSGDQPFCYNENGDVILVSMGLM